MKKEWGLLNTKTGRSDTVNNPQKPYCYKANDDTHPLCKGKEAEEEQTIAICRDCCLYENMRESCGEA